MLRWIGVLIVCCIFARGHQVHADIVLTQDEIKQLIQHGPWPPATKLDPSNRVSGNPKAIALGERLFNDTILSKDATMSCATCHKSDQNFQDGEARAKGRKALNRNTLALWNMQSFRWFGWSGDTDNLWAQSLTPITNLDEMAHNPSGIQTALMNSKYKTDYEELFGSMKLEKPKQTLVHTGKLLAAYLETLTTGKTSFDRFRDAIQEGNLDTAATYPDDAQRGLRIFLGTGNCSFCHSGPAFTNSEFHDAGVPYFLGLGRVDAGRTAGLEALKKSQYTLAGSYSDDPKKSGAWAVRNVRFLHSNFGVFRVPSLRRVAKTAPYMHDGSLQTLDDVLDHYNKINMERLHTDGEAILKPLDISPDDLKDLRAFLLTLSDD